MILSKPFTGESTDNIIIKNSTGIHKIHISDIIYAEALNRKVIIYLKNGEQITSTDVFSSICVTLTAHNEFLLPHRSFIVNMNYIKTINTTEICLINDKSIPLAQRRVSEIKKQYLTFSDGRLIHKKEGIYMDGLSAMLNLVNYVFVLIFGIVVSFYFADITWEDNKKQSYLHL